MINPEGVWSKCTPGCKKIVFLGKNSLYIYKKNIEVV